jgi:hypothetical protein
MKGKQELGLFDRRTGKSTGSYVPADLPQVKDKDTDESRR